MIREPFSPAAQVSAPPLHEEQPRPLSTWRTYARRLPAGVWRLIIFVGGVAAALFAVLLYQVLVPAPHQLTAAEVNESIAHAMASATPQPPFSALVYQVIQPSLVLIEAQKADASNPDQRSLGSGVVINDQGEILTALHVVTQATQIELTFADGTQSTAIITTAQPENDIAVLVADNPPAKLVAATLGNPNAERVGDEAFVVGNPFGLYGSMSSGVISGFGRSFQPEGSPNKLEDLIQIDAAVNPGNSGGPLLNRYGEVIGIVTGLVNPTDQNFFVGVGFAVPITTAAPAAGAPPY